MTSAIAQRAPVPDWAPAFETFAGGLVERHHIPGLAVMATVGGETAYVAGFGWRDVEQRLPVTPETLFGIGSVSKSFTALAIMQLVDRGAVRVADPVSYWLPAFRLPGELGARYTPGVTIHHLLTHSSGIPPEPALFRARAGSIRLDPDLGWLDPAPLTRARLEELLRPDPIATYDELLALMAALDYSPLGPPGSYFSYSNEGYALLAAIVERAAGQPFPAYVRAHITAPLGLERTGCRSPDFPLAPPLAQIYARGARDGTPGVYPSPHWWAVGEMFGNGNMMSCGRDLLRYARVFLGDGAVDGTRVVSTAAVAQMRAPHVAIPTGGWYGYGLAVHPDYHGVHLAGHGGGNKGISADLAFAHERGIAAVALANLGGVPASRAGRGALNALLGLPFETQADTYPHFPLAPNALTEYAGRYEGEDGMALTLLIENGALLEQGDGDAHPRAFRPYAADAFVAGSPGSEQAVRFLRDGAGAIWGLSTGLRVRRKVPVERAGS